MSPAGLFDRLSELCGTGSLLPVGLRLDRQEDTGGQAARATHPKLLLRNRSNIQNDFGEPTAFGLLDLQPVISNGLNFVRERVTCLIVRFTPHGG